MDFWPAAQQSVHTHVCMGLKFFILEGKCCVLNMKQAMFGLVLPRV